MTTITEPVIGDTSAWDVRLWWFPDTRPEDDVDMEKQRVATLVIIGVVVVAIVFWITGVFGFLSWGWSISRQETGPEDDDVWRIILDDDAVGIHTVQMIKTFTPPTLDELTDAAAEDLGGRLVWDETEIELGCVGVTFVTSAPSLQIAADFSTAEGCDTNTGMQQVFDDFGLPRTACVSVRWSTGDADEHCAPLAVD